MKPLMPRRAIVERTIDLVAVLQIKIFGLKIESIEVRKSCSHGLGLCFYLIE